MLRNLLKFKQFRGRNIGVFALVLRPFLRYNSLSKEENMQNKPITYEDIIKVSTSPFLGGEPAKAYQVGYLAQWIVRLSKDDYNLRKEIQTLLEKRNAR